MSEFQDCQYRYIKEDKLYCRNKDDEEMCDNCKENIHLNCSNYNPRKDMCLKWFEENISLNNKECREKTVEDDGELQRKWSN